MHRFAHMLSMLILAAGLTACGDRFPDYNYKMTIHVGDDAYSSVRRVEQEEVSSIVDSTGSTVRTRMQGEAVIIDRPNGRTYYALIAKPGSPQYGAFAAELALMPMIEKAQRGALENRMGRS